MSNLHRLSRNATLPAVGRDVEAWCSRCGMELTHRIMAMVGLEIAKVHCNTCGAEHKFKSAREATAAAASAEKAPPRERKPNKTAIAAAAAADRTTRMLYERAMADRDRANAVPYAPSMQPRPGMLIDHKTFGYGIVDAVYEAKSRMLFQDGYKVLATGR